MRTFTRLHSVLTLGLACAAGSCGSAGPTTLTISGSNFTEVEGKPIKVAIVDVGGKKVFKTFAGTVAAGRFTFSADVSPETKYRIDAFADDDGDGFCQFGVDHVYALDVAGLAEEGKFTANVTTNSDSRGCLAFGGSSLHVTLTDLPSTATGTVYKAALVKGNVRLGIPLVDSFTGGSIDFTFDGAMFPGTFYRVDIYIDNDKRDSCNAGDSFFSKQSTALPQTGQTPGLTGTTVPLAMMGLVAGQPGPDVATISICSSFQ